ncbi:MAG: hypothetical protein ABW133_22215 [Polyangiaceae bacterium]
MRGGSSIGAGDIVDELDEIDALAEPLPAVDEPTDVCEVADPGKPDKVAVASDLEVGEVASPLSSAAADSVVTVIATMAANARRRFAVGRWNCSGRRVKCAPFFMTVDHRTSTNPTSRRIHGARFTLSAKVLDCLYLSRPQRSESKLTSGYSRFS